jgi:Methyltransferase domain
MRRRPSSLRVPDIVLAAFVELRRRLREVLDDIQDGRATTRLASRGEHFGSMDDVRDFHSNHYLRLNQRRLEHLSTLGLPLTSRTVLELGAGIGDLSPFFLDRDCEVTSIDARPENVDRIRSNIAAYYAFYPSSGRPEKHRVRLFDLEKGDGAGLGTFDVVHCYGVLYHVADPARMIQLMSETCLHLCLVETCVSPGRQSAIHPTREDATAPSQAVHGLGCRPTRTWVFDALRSVFRHVYVPIAQPNHEEFPIDWTGTNSGPILMRAVFVASREPLDNLNLIGALPDRQTRC